mgnify:CR=1 FL=1
MGRRRYLAHKLKLDRDWRGPCSSAWWRVKGKVSVNDFVPKSNVRWHARVEDDRWQSTTHMMGKGYWVWLIPVAPDNTSVGIVTSEAIHPINTYGLNYEQALEWLRKHEPVVAQALEGHELMDFLKLKRYSHTATQLEQSPILDDLRERCPIAHTDRYGGAWLPRQRELQSSSVR